MGRPRGRGKEKQRTSDAAREQGVSPTRALHQDNDDFNDKLSIFSYPPHPTPHPLHPTPDVFVKNIPLKGVRGAFIFRLVVRVWTGRPVTHHRVKQQK